MELNRLHLNETSTNIIHLYFEGSLNGGRQEGRQNYVSRRITGRKRNGMLFMQSSEEDLKELVR